MLTFKDSDHPEPIANFIDAYIPEDTKVQNEDYQWYQRPPDISIAKKHGMANRYGEAIVSENEQDKCPCCGKPADLKQLGICCSRRRFSFNGPGIAMYFDFLVYCVGILFLYGCVSSGFNIWQNYEGDKCGQNTELCNDTYFNKFSLTNRTTQENHLNAILNFIASVLIMITTLLYRRQINRLEIEIDDSEIAVQDFSIIVRNLPIDATEDEIMNYFSEIEHEGRKLEVKKICMGYNIDPINKVNKLIKKKVKEISMLISSQVSVQEIEVRRKQIEAEIQALDNKKDQIVDDYQLLAFSGVCFVSFNTEEMAEHAIREHNISEFEILLMKLLKIFNINKGKMFRGNTIISASKAPEPGDVLWENLGITYNEIVKNRIITTIASGFVLSICFGIILGISLLQIKVLDTADKSNQTVETLIQALGFAASILVVLINQVLGIVMRKFALFEKDSSKTEFNISIAKKLGLAQFTNTALITLIVNILVCDSTKNFVPQVIKSGGLNQSVGLIIITNAAFTGITLLINPTHLIKIIKRKIIQYQGSRCNLTQKDANKVFEGTKIDLADKYAQVTKTIMLTFFYAYLLPVGVIIGMIGLAVLYWIEKIILLRRDKQPPPLGTALSEEMVGFQIEITIIMLAAGCCVWETLIYNELRTITLVQVVLALSFWVLPMELIFAKCIEIDSNATPQTYEQSKHMFWDDYDRRNPVTKERALEAWVGAADVSPRKKNAYEIKKRHKNDDDKRVPNFQPIQYLNSTDPNLQNLSMKSMNKKPFLTPKNETRITLIGKSEFGSPNNRVFPQDADEDQYSVTNFSSKKKTITPQQIESNNLQNVDDDEGAIISQDLRLSQDMRQNQEPRLARQQVNTSSERAKQPSILKLTSFKSQESNNYASSD